LPNAVENYVDLDGNGTTDIVTGNVAGGRELVSVLALNP
jgi:hypothetical protein